MFTSNFLPKRGDSNLTGRNSLRWNTGDGSALRGFQLPDGDGGAGGTPCELCNGWCCNWSNDKVLKSRLNGWDDPPGDQIPNAHSQSEQKISNALFKKEERKIR